MELRLTVIKKGLLHKRAKIQSGEDSPGLNWVDLGGTGSVSGSEVPSEILSLSTGVGDPPLRCS